MGEYATYQDKEIKIGTCEQMYYLRADQVRLVQPKRGSVNPRSAAEAGSIRFRFPFPNEDSVEPGAFSDHDYGLGLYGLEVPEDIDHDFLQFSRTYPQSHGILLCTPCPRSKEGKASGLKFSYNGYNGPVHIHSQRLVNGQLHLILRCGDCGALYRLDSLEECKDVLAVLDKYESERKTGFYAEIANRIVAGYIQPNFWTV